MDMLILIGGFCVLCLLDMPVAYALGLAAIFAALWIDLPLEAVMLKTSDGMDDFALLAIPSWGPLRNPETGALIGDSPFMSGLIVAVTLIFLAAGLGYGLGAKTLTSITDVTGAMEKAVAGLGGLIFLLFIISQFLAFFTYSNMATLAAVELGDALESAGGSVVLPSFKQPGANGTAIHINRPLKSFADHSWSAVVNVAVEPDGLVRRYQFGETFDGQYFPAMGAVLAEQYSKKRAPFLVDFSIRAASIPRVSYVDVLRGDGLAAVLGTGRLPGGRRNFQYPGLEHRGAPPGRRLHRMGLERFQPTVRSRTT